MLEIISDGPGSDEGGCGVGKVESRQRSRSSRESLDTSRPDGSTAVEIKRAYSCIDRQSLNDSTGPVHADEIVTKIESGERGVALESGGDGDDPCVVGGIGGEIQRDEGWVAVF